MKKIIAGNWKMNAGGADGSALAREIVEALSENVANKATIILCPPFINISSVISDVAGSIVAVGGQDCSEHDEGAYTGQISAGMLKEAKCEYVILGHSERRQYQNEGDDLISRKAVAGHNHGLITIICVGETEEEREAGKEQDVVAAQLKGAVPDCATAQNTIIAYEPVWAIGTGKTASADDVKDMHAFIHQELKNRFKDGAEIAILYGGSVKPGNAQELLSIEHVDGALVGGASLKADQFLGIIDAI